MKTDWEKQVINTARLIRNLTDAADVSYLEAYERFNLRSAAAKAQGELEQLIFETPKADLRGE